MENSPLPQKTGKTSQNFTLEGYEHLELSTQMLIREAKKQGITVDIIDPSDNFISLRKGEHKEYVRKGSETRLDPLISYFLMENKVVTKFVLNEAGFRVPKGQLFHSKEDALDSYEHWKDLDVVVKPKSTNFGLGVGMVLAGAPGSFSQSVHEAFRHQQQVIIEEYFHGQEYRFLVIGNRVEAVCMRLPANVTGDGIHNIRQLVRLKNRDPHCYKIPEYYIRLRQTEKGILAEQNLTIDSIPKKGQQIFLRRNSNVSTGGDPVDVTDEVTPPYKELAVAASQLVHAHFCGVDMIVHDFSLKPTPDNYCFIELNFNPALYLHRYPVQGTPRLVEKAVLRELGF